MMFSPGTQLIRDKDGAARPWGHGATQSRGVPSGFVFPCCNRQTRKPAQVLAYADGDQACAECAQTWAEAHWTPPPQTDKPGQISWLSVDWSASL